MLPPPAGPLPGVLLGVLQVNVDFESAGHPGAAILAALDSIMHALRAALFQRHFR